MLALMAGRNGGKALTHVRNGEVECSVHYVLGPAEPVCLVAEHVLVSLWLVWTPIKWYGRWTEEDRRVSRIRKNRTSDCEPVGWIWNHPVHIHDENRISAKDGR